MPTPEPSKVLYIRGVPTALAQKLKAAAALQGQSLQNYLVQMLRAHVTELERKGALPKGK
jgi:predicted HicB family RNase H-like nuclease